MPDAAVEGTVNPLGIDGADAVIDWLEAVAGLAALLSIALATASLVIRFRRSRGVERQQLKWFASAALLFALACVSFLALAGPLEFLGQLLILPPSRSSPWRRVSPSCATVSTTSTSSSTARSSTAR